jgi:hypothetical protein
MAQVLYALQCRVSSFVLLTDQAITDSSRLEILCSRDDDFLGLLPYVEDSRSRWFCLVVVTWFPYAGKCRKSQACSGER